MLTASEAGGFAPARLTASEATGLWPALTVVSESVLETERRWQRRLRPNFPSYGRWLKAPWQYDLARRLRHLLGRRALGRVQKGA